MGLLLSSQERESNERSLRTSASADVEMKHSARGERTGLFQERDSLAPILTDSDFWEGTAAAFEGVALVQKGASLLGSPPGRGRARLEGIRTSWLPGRPGERQGRFRGRLEPQDPEWSLPDVPEPAEGHTQPWLVCRSEAEVPDFRPGSSAPKKKDVLGRHCSLPCRSARPLLDLLRSKSSEISLEPAAAPGSLKITVWF